MPARAASMSPGKLSKLLSKRIGSREAAGKSPGVPCREIRGTGLLQPFCRGQNLYRAAFPGTRQRRVLFDGQEHCSRGPGSVFTLFPGNAEQCMSAQTADPGRRITAGSQQRDQLFTGTGCPGSVQQGSIQTFRTIRKPGCFFRFHGTEPVQQQRIQSGLFRSFTGKKSGTDY